MKVQVKQEEIKLSGTNKLLVNVDILNIEQKKHMVCNKQQSEGWCRNTEGRKYSSVFSLRHRPE
jgi:hypothetical protein